MQNLPLRPTYTNADISDTLKAAYETLETLGSGTWIVIRCRKLLRKLVSIIEASSQSQGDRGDEVEPVFPAQAQSPLADFPLSVSDWNSILASEQFPIDLDHLAF
jgi:hypothetical protein